jgi:hypothetical protein
MINPPSPFSARNTPCGRETQIQEILMAQEDKGLILRGLFLLAAIGSVVAVVLAMLFWRPETQPPTLQALPELGQTMPSAPGWDIRYNAAAALARRGSASVPWDLIHEMLDERQQMKNNRVRLDDGQDVYDEAAARAIMVSALRALAAWHEKQPADKKHEVPADLREIYQMVDKLTESPLVELKEQAEKARATFFETIRNHVPKRL